MVLNLTQVKVPSRIHDLRLINLSQRLQPAPLQDHSSQFLPLMHDWNQRIIRKQISTNSQSLNCLCTIFRDLVSMNGAYQTCYVGLQNSSNMLSGALQWKSSRTTRPATMGSLLNVLIVYHFYDLDLIGWTNGKIVIREQKIYPPSSKLSSKHFPLMWTKNTLCAAPTHEKTQLCTIQCSSFPFNGSRENNWNISYTSQLLFHSSDQSCSRLT